MDDPNSDNGAGSLESEVSPETAQAGGRISFVDGLSVPDDFDTMFAAKIEQMSYGDPDKFFDLERAEPTE